VRLIPLDYKKTLKPESNRTADGWEINFHVPFDFIQKFLPAFEPKEGYQFYGNCYKCGDLTVKPHYFSWNPIEPGVLDFHCPKFFGQMILGGAE
jgi:hypothetical protein